MPFSTTLTKFGTRFSFAIRSKFIFPAMTRQAKSRKVNLLEGYVDGSIVRIKAEDFLTYDSVEFRPGPHLNVIIGPNGTGKSTIVCAICLGLGGKTNLLGRASQPADFIKHGCQLATIEIELMNNSGDNYIIRREISKNNQSTWSVNNRSATLKSVEETVNRLNIQVGNLCQFLPQDKVADFAKMSQKELLESTEKAVGGNELFENHQKLMNAREEGRRLLQEHVNTQELLEQEKQKNARLEQDVKNYRERERFLDKIKMLKMKRPWVEYEEKRQAFFDEKKKREEMTKEFKKAQKEHAPLRDKLEKAKARVQTAEAVSKKRSEEIKEHAKVASAKSKQIEDANDKVTEIMDDIKAKRLEETKRKKKIQDLQNVINGWQEELANQDENEDVQPQIDKVNDTIRQINQQLSRMQQQGEYIRSEVNQRKAEINALQAEQKRLADVANQRLNLLRQKHKDTFNAVQWLRSNRHLFKADIHEPIMTVVNVKDPKYSKYVESHISFQDMRAFICEDKDDCLLFMKHVRDQQGLRVNAVIAPSEPLSAFKPRVHIDDYRQYGFCAYLKDLFDGPDAVMRYLCKLYNVHTIPVGNEQAKSNVEAVINNCRELRTFYTENHQYSVKVSRYDPTQTSSRCMELRAPNLLTVTSDTAREQEVAVNIEQCLAAMREKENEYKDIQNQHKGLEGEMNTLRNEKKKLSEKRDLKRSLQQKIRTKEESIKRLNSEKIDVEKEERNANKKIQNIYAKRCRDFIEFKNSTKNCVDLSIEKLRASISVTQAQYECQRYEAEIRDKSHALRQLEQDFERQSEKVDRLKEQATTLLHDARKATNTPKGKDLSPELMSAFETCPATVEEIDNEIHDIQARADCTFAADKNVVDEYNKREAHIRRLTQDEATKLTAVATHQQQIEEVKSKWLDPLQGLIERINKNFSFFFQAMKCAGEVDLNIPENPEDYEKYGIRIKVKYRDTEQLRELTATHQSGGERSVATVLYMMALQELAKCPFRCVDEINQGMDPYNERKVFELITQTVCQRNTSQYFLLTPKLLPDLAYGDNMTVLCIYNGPHMLNHTEWRLSKFIKKRQRITSQSAA